MALVYDGLCTFEFSIVAEIFGLPRPEMGSTWYRFASAATESGALHAQGGLWFRAECGLELIDEADLIVAPGWKGAGVEVPEALCESLRRAHARGARIASICSGAFVLAASGLLDGKRATTHWRYAEALKRLHPDIEVDADVLYVEEDRVYTSAGSAAGIDLMLHIVRQDFGAQAANSVARRLVTPPQRSGGQAQFVERPVPTDPRDRLSGLLQRIQASLAEQWNVPRMAREAAMSQRTLVRRFIATTGLSPAEWVTAARVAEARQLLETTKLPTEEVAARSGFASVETLRRCFRDHSGLSPRDYRRTFG